MVRPDNQKWFDSRVGVAAFLLFAVAVVCAGCNRTTANRSDDGQLRTIVGIPPLAYLVEQIGGEHVKVDAIVQPGQDPHTFEATPRQVAAISRATVFFKIDMPFETALLQKIQEGNRRLVVVDATQGIKKRPLDGPCCSDTSGHEHDHESHGVELDPHVWLSPPLLKTMAGNITVGLCQADPDHQKEYRKNLAALERQIDALHERIGKKMSPFRGRTFFVFHPGFAYFADAYGLKEEAVQVGGQEPTAKQIRSLIEKAKAERVKTVFIQPEFDQRSVQFIADALGGRVVQINGLGGHVLADIEDIAAKMEKAMREGTP